jgi:arylsulfatase A-like enzyme
MGPPHTHNLPLSSGKGGHREGGLRVPLLVRWPAVVKPKSVCHTPVIIQDWFPTLCEAGQATDVPSSNRQQAGAASCPRIDGLSLLPLLRSEPAPQRFSRPLIWHFPNLWGPLGRPAPVAGPGMGPSSTIRRGDWKLIYYHDGPRFELFYLADDLGERRNLAAERRRRVQNLARELGDYLRAAGATMPIVTATNRPVPWPDEFAGPPR